jgi:PGF-CTERM protein
MDTLQRMTSSARLRVKGDFTIQKPRKIPWIGRPARANDIRLPGDPFLIPAKCRRFGMKSMMKLMIVALVAVAMMALPSAARGPTINDLKPGDAAFVYEGTVTPLNVSTLDADAVHAPSMSGLARSPPTSFRKYANDQPDPTIAGGGSMLAEIPLNADGTLSLLTAPPYMGIWFPYNASAPSAGYKVNANNSIQIQHADVMLDAVLNNSHTDSIAAKSAPRDNNIAFKLTSTYAGNYYKHLSTAGSGNYYDALVNIELTTPGGGKIQIFGNNAVDLRNIALNGSLEYTDSLEQGAQAIGGVGSAIDLTGVEAGTYTATAKWTASMPWYNLESNSNSITFTVLSRPIVITTNKESVFRGNSFVVTITGEAMTSYFVYIRNVSASLPVMAAGQPFVNQTGASDDPDGAETSRQIQLTPASRLLWLEQNLNDAPDTFGAEANVTTAADGTRSIQFNTDTGTDDQKYTIKVLNPADLSKYDQVDVTIEAGEITITYEGAGTCYLGETIKITGTNTDNTTVYLALRGPNLNDGGVSLADIFFRADGRTPGGSGDNVRFKMVDVNTDNTWSYKWDTSKLNQSGAVSLDAGTYTVYAVAVPVVSLGATDLAGVTYQTASVVLKKPFVTASTSTNTLAKGDKLEITGTAEGKPNNVFVWIFGKNYRSLSNSQDVASDATFDYTLDRPDTADLHAGQYFVVIQHPMMNGIQDVMADAAGTDGTQAQVNGAGTWALGGPFVTLSGLQASDAATALVDLLNSPNIDDSYTRLSFMIEEPWIRIDTVGDKHVGDTFKITGTTNLAEGDTILMTVTSSSFQPTEKTQTGEFSGASGSVTVQKGDTDNTFSFDADASTFKPDEYLVKAEAIEPSQSTTTTFNVLEDQPTTGAATAPATPVVTAVQTLVSTTAVATSAPATTAKPQPGFGALVALVSLGAGALFVLRGR